MLLLFYVLVFFFNFKALVRYLSCGKLPQGLLHSSLLPLYVLFFLATKFVCILAPQPGIKFISLALEGKVVPLDHQGSPPGVILICVWLNPSHCWLNSWMQTHRHQGVNVLCHIMLIRDLKSLGFWHLWSSWKQSPVATDRWLYPEHNCRLLVQVLDSHPLLCIAITWKTRKHWCLGPNCVYISRGVGPGPGIFKKPPEWF